MESTAEDQSLHTPFDDVHVQSVSGLAPNAEDLQDSLGAAKKDPIEEHHDQLEDESMSEPGRLPLHRHIYEIYGPGHGSGSKVGRVTVERANCPYHAWPLYNDFKAIKKADTATWPPERVNLQDWHVYELLKEGFAAAKLQTRWPADFMYDGRVNPKRKPKGRAAKMTYTGGDYFYVVVNGVYQLSGDEGAQAVITIPPPVECETDDIKKHIGPGQDCDVQDDFIPTVDELMNGTRLDRITDQAMGRRPLNNRDDWGPLKRADRPKEKKPRKSKKDHTIEAADDDDDSIVVASSSKSSKGGKATVKKETTPAASTPIPMDRGSDDEAAVTPRTLKRAHSTDRRHSATKSIKKNSSSTPSDDAIEAQEESSRLRDGESPQPFKTRIGTPSIPDYYAGLGTPIASHEDRLMENTAPIPLPQEITEPVEAENPIPEDEAPPIASITNTTPRTRTFRTSREDLATNPALNKAFTRFQASGKFVPPTVVNTECLSRAERQFQAGITAAQQDLMQAKTTLDAYLHMIRLDSANSLLERVRSDMADWFAKAGKELIENESKEKELKEKEGNAAAKNAENE